MKPTKLIKISLTCLAFAVMCGVAQAQPTNLLGNPGFEKPDIGKYTNFDVGGPTPYWSDDGVNYTNTGVENTGAHSGTYRAWEMSGDDGAYQISTNSVALKLGDQVILAWWALGTYNGSSSTFDGTGATDPMQIVGIITATNYNSDLGGNDSFANTTPVLIQSNGVSSAAWAQYSITYTAQAKDVGKYPGVFFNTQQVGGTNNQNSFAAYDDFALYVVSATSPPIILSSPGSQTSPLGGTNVFAVSALDATSYQWQAGAVGSGVYTNLSNGTNVVGGITNVVSGVTTTNLTIRGVTTNDTMDIVVKVSNTYGSVTSSPPANLTVAAVLYTENFSPPAVNGSYPNQPISCVGWMNDITSSFGGRIFTDNQGYTHPQMAVYSYDGSAGIIEAFYGTTATINGGPYQDGSYPPVSNHMAFPGINLGVAQNVSFVVNGQGSWQGALITNRLMVQMNFGQWYVSTNFFIAPSDTVQRNYSLKFVATSNAWKQVTVSGVGSDTVTYTPVVGAQAASDLTGYITGIGLLCQHNGSSTFNMDGFTVLAAIPPNPLPVFSALPQPATNYTGTTATFAAAANSNGNPYVITYQWQSRPATGGTFANLSNGGQYSGVTAFGVNSSTLVISNVTSSANHKEYAVVATDGAGSVLSALAPLAVPAILTVVDSAPLPVSGALVYPNNAPGFSSTSYTLEAGNNNVMNFTASFVGNLPITYHWQYSTTNDGTGVMNIQNATSTTYTLNNPQTSDSGYYRLQASNSISGATATNSGWAQLTVLPATNAFIKWSAPVAINPTPTTALTAAQILGLLGTFVEAESFYGATVVNITNGGTVYVFDNAGAAVSTSSTVKQITGGYSAARRCSRRHFSRCACNSARKLSGRMAIRSLSPFAALICTSPLSKSMLFTLSLMHSFSLSPHPYMSFDIRAGVPSRWEVP